MPAIDPIKLKRLKINALLVTFAMKRGLSPAQLADLVERAMADDRFDLNAANDEFANFLVDEDDARYWAEELEGSSAAEHLFTTADKKQKSEENTFGGYTQAELAEMTCEQRLRVANQVEFERAATR